MNIIKEKILKNGVRIVAEEIPYVKSVSLGVWINVGSRMESEDNRGIAHFIEHMLFKGTKTRSAKKISNDIDYYGGNINAFTTHDHTCYHVKMPYNHIDRGIEVLADILKNSVFDENEIEKEKSVIREELKMYEDSPEDYVYEELLKRVHSNKGIGRNVLGTLESIQDINREKIIDFFDSHYVANNSVIVASGNFDFDDLVDKIEDNFSSWKSYDVSTIQEGQDFLPIAFVEDREDEQANIAIVFECPDDRVDKDFYGVKLLGNILGNSPSSRLFQHIREEKGLSYSIYSSDSFYRNYAEFGIYASMAIDNLKEVYRLVKKEIADLLDNSITRDELLFAKEQYKGSVLMNIEDTEDRMLLIGEYEIEGKKLKSTEEISQIVDDIDIDYMKGLIDRIFSKPMAIGVTGKGVKAIMKGVL